uniref:GIY-YIG domain-containing protein n=1 Tax=Morchella brunnea TaxID=1174671 RepID=A0A8K1I828_9PEZI|nr:hypothetical protein LK370_mgp018 [Morchella brunnea]UBU98409.1 hypothetical protein [Morchella brunnea]
MSRLVIKRNKLSVKTYLGSLGPWVLGWKIRGVYRWTNNTNGKSYVGRGVDLSVRLTRFFFQTNEWILNSKKVKVEYIARGAGRAPLQLPPPAGPRPDRPRCWAACMAWGGGGPLSKRGGDPHAGPNIIFFFLYYFYFIIKKLLREGGYIKAWVIKL